ncbi:MAG: DUF5011 domain-containing protein [Candidatus Kerfeldbacteria bacterium]|nr:DUF5011 domain-containing protein [Candidatus Kerfeldbacteria bacterium]
MKIAMIGQKGIPATWGGVEQHVDHLSQELRALGHEIFVYSREYYVSPSFVAAYNKQQAGIQVISLPTIQSKNIDTIVHTFLATMHAILFVKPDIYHFHSVGPSLLSWLPRVLRPRAKVIVTFHCEDRLHQKWGRFARFMLTLGEWTATHFPHQTITVSKTLTAYALEKYGCTGVYIPNGVDIVAPLAPAQITEQWGLTQGNYMLTVARLVRHKGVHHLIEAFKKTTTDKKLVIVGGSTHTDEYVQYLHKLAGDDRRIIFTGFQRGTVLNELFANAYLYIQPSESEGLSVAVLEAASFARPIVASDIPANAEIVAGNGLLFRNMDTTDLQKQLLFGLEHTAQMREAGKQLQRHIQKEYNWQAIAKEVNTVYNHLSINKQKIMSYAIPVRHMKRIIPFLFFAVVSIGFFMVSTRAVSAATFTVNGTVDDYDNSPADEECMGEKTNLCTLRAAIMEANELPGEDTVYLPAGTYLLGIPGADEDSGFMGDLDIKDELVIIGDGSGTTVIQPQEMSGFDDRVFDILETGQLTLQGIMVTGMAYTNDYCSGMIIQNYSEAPLVIDDVRVENVTCEAPTIYGGLIASWSDAQMTISNSVFDQATLIISGNYAGVIGGGILTYGNVQLNNTTISNISVQGSGTQLTYVYGLGVYASTVEMDHSRIVNNTASTDGYGEMRGAGMMTSVGTIQHSTVNGNSFSANEGLVGGAGIHGYEFTLLNSTITDNSALVTNGESYGAGIMTEGGGRVTIMHSTISNNVSHQSGSQIYNFSSTPIMMSGSIVNSEESVENCDIYDSTISVTDSGGYNIDNGNSCGFSESTDQVNTDPLLDENGLADNGGSTLTIALQAASPAINVVPETACLNLVDQRDVARDSLCDVGAYEYVDTSAPVVTVIGSNAMDIECRVTYTDLGATATDDVDGDLTNTISTTNPVDVNTTGAYTVNYAVVDFANNAHSATRTVNVLDTLAPSMVMNGASSVEIAQGETYVDSGVTATDGCDSTVEVTTTNAVNTAVAGTYTVTYTATDDSGNSSDTLNRTVVVVAAAVTETPDNNGEDNGGDDVEEVVDETPDAEEEVRSIISVSPTEDGTLVITYEDGSSAVITPFDGNADFQYVMSGVADRVIVTNGKFVRLYVHGERVAQQRINKKKPKFVQLTLAQMFDGYESIVLLTKRQGKLKTTAVRVTSDNDFTKHKRRVQQLTDGQSSKELGLTVKEDKHRILVSIGKKEMIYKLTKKGILKEIVNE